MEEAEILLRNAMEHHGAAVYRLALCRMQSVQDAEDVYQDVFLRLLGQEASAWTGSICGPGCCGSPSTSAKTSTGPSAGRRCP